MEGANRRGGGDGVIAAILMVMMLVVGVAWGYARFRGEINQALLTLHRALLVPFLWDPEAARVSRMLAAQEPADLTWAHMTAQMGYVGTWWRWLIPLPLWWGAFALYRRATAFSRAFRMKTLLQHNVRVFPALAPIAWRDLDQEPLHEGPWRAAMAPIEFACVHRLIVDEQGTAIGCDRFLHEKRDDPRRAGLVRDNSRGDVATEPLHVDRARAGAVFARQLGRRFTGIEALRDHEAGLAAAFVLFGLGDRVRAWALLDHLSLSFREGGSNREKRVQAAMGRLFGGKPEPAPRHGPSVSIEFAFAPDGRTPERLHARVLLERFASHPEVEAAVALHNAFTATWLTALLRFARRKGVIAPAEFIWLRPTDRTLWYALHQVSEAIHSGGAGVDRGLAVWPEAAGVRAHMAAEGVLGRALANPWVEEATDALIAACEQEGWVQAAGSVE